MKTFAAAVLVAAGTSVLPMSAFGQAMVIPGEVESYVVQEQVPSVTVEREVVVGAELPDTVEIRRVPKYDKYGYAVVNKRRVIVEPGTRKVVKIID